MSHPKLSCLAATAILVLSASVAWPREGRTYPSRSILVLDGANCGFLNSVDGGAVVGQVLEDASRSGAYVLKRLGAPQCENFVLEVGLGNARTLYDWIGQFYTAQAGRRAGGIITMDGQAAPKSERRFTAGMLVETILPAMDAAGKEPAFLTLKIRSGMIQMVNPTAVPAGEAATKEQKTLLSSSFKFEIDGIDCSRVSRVEPVSATYEVVETAVGNDKFQTTGPGKVNCGNLKITLSETAARPFIDWHSDFVIQGRAGASQEKNGSLTFLATNRTAPLARARFYGLGILAVRPLTKGTNPDQVQVEMYVQRMEFEYLAAEAAPTAPASKPPARRAS